MNRRTFYTSALAPPLRRGCTPRTNARPASCCVPRGKPSTSATSATRRACSRCLKKYLPEAEVRLWPSSVDNGVDEMLHRGSRSCAWLWGRLNKGRVCGVRLSAARSGPSFVAERDVAKW